MNAEASKVLIIDDDDDIALMIKMVLASEGFNATVCSTAFNFPHVPVEGKPNLIVMDMLLAGKDGRELCRKLKQEEATKNVPVLMMSAHPDAERSCRSAGADDFLIKPFEIKNLLIKAKRLLRP
jgi:two-component system alkaline phosphatase synthesis response regulator PhoP